MPNTNRSQEEALLFMKGLQGSTPEAIASRNPEERADSMGSISMQQYVLNSHDSFPLSGSMLVSSYPKEQTTDSMKSIDFISSFFNSQDSFQRLFKSRPPAEFNSSSNMELVQSYESSELPVLQGAAPRSGAFDSTGWSMRSGMSVDGDVRPERIFGSLTLDDTSNVPVPVPVPGTESLPYRDADVLCGRGGSSNHPGNQAYLKKKEGMQAQYKAAATDKEKTAMSKELIDYVHQRGGRFMKRDPKDKQRWFEISDAEAKTKCSQALRDANTSPEKAKQRAETDFDE